MKKPLACLLALALALALVACGGESLANETAAGETAARTDPPAAETAEPGALEAAATEAQSETTGPDETAADETTTGETGEAPALPTDTAGIVAYFNAALGSTNMRRSAFKRTMTKVTAWAAFGLVDEKELETWNSVKRLANVDETKTAPSDLVALRPEWVRAASASAGGGTATLEIQLKDHPLADIDPKPGTYGYVSTIDKATAVQLVIDASILLTNGILTSADVTTTLFSLENGAYTVAVDTRTGKIKSVRFTGTQAAEGDAKCRASIVPVPGMAAITLRGDLTATYLPV